MQSLLDVEIETLCSLPHIDTGLLRKTILKYQTSTNEKEKNALRDIIFNNNIRLIKKLTLQKVRRNSPVFQDLFSCAIVGFLEGLEKYKLKANQEFSTYIKFWIKNEIYRYFYKSNLLYIPKSRFNKKRYKEDLSEFYNNSNFVRLESEIKSGDRAITLKNDTENPEEQFMKSHDIELVRRIADRLFFDKEKTVLELTFLSKDYNSLRYLAASKKIGYNLNIIGKMKKRVLKKFSRFYRELSNGDVKFSNIEKREIALKLIKEKYQ